MPPPKTHSPKRAQPAVGVVCFRGEDVLLIQRGTPPLIGEWSLPGGRIEYKELAQDAALRELKEETGVSAEIICLVDVVDAIFHRRHSSEVTRHYILFDFAARYRSGTPVAGDDADNAAWISPQELQQIELWDETRRVIDAARTALFP